MVITRAPFRISFFGGGTDFPAHFNEHGGQVLSTTIDKYCYVQMRHLPPFFDHSIEISYSRKERVSSIDEIQHPSIREAMRMLGMDNIILNYDADLPARSGLGTSSSFAVAMLMGFHALKARQVDSRRLALEAIHLEREMCKESGGIQDQVAAAYGGMNEIFFNHSGFDVRPVIIPSSRLAELKANLLLFFTGFSRYSHEIQKNYETNIAKKRDQLLRTQELAREAVSILRTGDLDDFGRLMHIAWRLKKEASPSASNSELDAIYDAALGAGAEGGKILGAGGGGFLLIYACQDQRDNVLNALKGLRHIPFNFESGGPKVIYYTEDEY